MRKVARLVTILIVALLSAFVLFFVLENQQVSELTIFGMSLPALPISVSMMLALVVGMMLGSLPGIYGTYKLRRKLRSR